MTVAKIIGTLRHWVLAVAIIGLALLISLPSAHAQTESGTIDSGQFNLDYRIEGTGTPAIVIGFPNYYSQVFSKELRSHLRLVFVDHRGSAPSPGKKPLSDFSLERISDDLELIRSELELGQVVIIGHSGHGLMALEYAKRYPDSISHVVVIGISPDLSDESRSQAEMYWDQLATAERKAALEQNWEGVPEEEPADTYPGENFIKTYVRNGPMAWYDYNFDSTSLWKGVEVNMDMFNHVWGTLLAEIDITRNLKALDKPVFLALGKYDFLIAPPSSWDPIKPEFKNLTMRVFDQSGHTPQYEEAELFDSELLGWLNSSAPD